MYGAPIGMKIHSPFVCRPKQNQSICECVCLYVILYFLSLFRTIHGESFIDTMKVLKMQNADEKQNNSNSNYSIGTTTFTTIEGNPWAERKRERESAQNYMASVIWREKLMLVLLLLFSIFMQKINKERNLLCLFIVTVVGFCYYFEFKRNTNTQHTYTYTLRHRNIIVVTIITSVVCKWVWHFRLSLVLSFIFIFLLLLFLNWCLLCMLLRLPSHSKMGKKLGDENHGNIPFCMHVFVWFSVLFVFVMYDINECWQILVV